jgi:hypothetical protein
LRLFDETARLGLHDRAAKTPEFPPSSAASRRIAGLSPEDRTLVEQLGAILRFADGLDHSHTNVVHDLRCERWANAKKARWFEAVFGVRVISS